MYSYNNREKKKNSRKKKSDYSYSKKHVRIYLNQKRGVIKKENIIYYKKRNYLM